MAKRNKNNNSNSRISEEAIVEKDVNKNDEPMSYGEYLETVSKEAETTPNFSIAAEPNNVQATKITVHSLDDFEVSEESGGQKNLDHYFKVVALGETIYHMNLRYTETDTYATVIYRGVPNEVVITQMKKFQAIPNRDSVIKGVLLSYLVGKGLASLV